MKSYLIPFERWKNEFIEKFSFIQKFNALILCEKWGVNDKLYSIIGYIIMWTEEEVFLTNVVWIFGSIFMRPEDLHLDLNVL